MAKKKPIRWTEKHQREALAWILAHWLRRVGGGVNVGTVIVHDGHVRHEGAFRGTLYGGGVSGPEIDAAVRRVDGLATGRLVRETETRIRMGRGNRVRVTRIRRAP